MTLPSMTDYFDPDPGLSLSAVIKNQVRLSPVWFMSVAKKRGISYCMFTPKIMKAMVNCYQLELCATRSTVIHFTLCSPVINIYTYIFLGLILAQVGAMNHIVSNLPLLFSRQSFWLTWLSSRNTLASDCQLYSLPSQPLSKFCKVSLLYYSGIFSTSHQLDTYLSQKARV